MRKFFKFVLILSLIVFSAVTILMFTIYIQSLGVKFDENKFVNKNRLTFFDNNSEKIVNASSVDNNYVTIDQMPDNLINALISVEDKKFFTHNGIDYRRLAGALISNIKSGHFKEGGSTISQQLIKNTHLSNEKSLKRKMSEFRLTRKLEKTYSKNQILEKYLNTIYFGNNSYGIFNASRNYFGKLPKSLTLSECATLIGLIKAPSKYNPIKNAELCKQRRDLVLKIMLNDNKINNDDYFSTVKQEITLNKNTEKTDYSVYLSEVLKELCTVFGITENEAFVKDYKIYTYFMPKEQNMIAESMKNFDFNANKVYCGAGVLIDNYSNGVNCLYSSKPLLISELKRQIGSTIKPLLVYSPAIEKRIVSPISTINDVETDFNGYKPKNYDNLFKGKISVKTAMIESRNVPAVKLYQWTGEEYCKNFIKNLNIDVTQENQLSLALGGMKNGVSLLDIANAYTAYPNLGKFKNYSFIKSIVDENGKIIYNNEKKPKTVMRDSTAFLTTDMLKSCAKSGTGKILNSIYTDIACKTGTVGNKNGNSDAYMISYTQDKCLGVWLGSENNINLMNNRITGGSSCGMISKSILSQLPKSTDYIIPESIEMLRLDSISLENNQIELANDIMPVQYVSNVYLERGYQKYRTSTRFLIPEVKNLQLNIDRNLVNISFQAEEYYKYFIFKKNFLNSKIISVVENTKGEYSISDFVNNNEICYYEIVPYFINCKNHVYEGKSLRTRIVFML